MRAWSCYCGLHHPPHTEERGGGGRWWGGKGLFAGIKWEWMEYVGREYLVMLDLT